MQRNSESDQTIPKKYMYIAMFALIPLSSYKELHFVHIGISPVEASAPQVLLVKLGHQRTLSLSKSSEPTAILHNYDTSCWQDIRHTDRHTQKEPPQGTKTSAADDFISLETQL